ncbi:MAG: polysaccharide biosynthesis tyrosine autokinase [Thermodesulfobacteriota bacterium]
MSKIYKALEKAEREREGIPRRAFSPVTPLREPRPWERKRSVVPRLGEGVGPERQLVSFHQPKSLGAEQFRKLRTYLLQMNIQSPPRTIMVTSATSGEGKTFVSANLAAGLARDLHAHALLVDCDLRVPSLASLFGFSEAWGLSDYLKEGRNISDLLLKTDIEKLSLLPGGTIPENPTELIGSKKMEDLVLELRSRYSDRYVIFDSTPLLATSESEVLSTLVDGIIIVVRAGVTPRETVKRALASLEKKKMLGFVLNHLEFKSPGLHARYFGSSGYYDHYGYEKQKSKDKKRWKILF